MARTQYLVLCKSPSLQRMCYNSTQTHGILCLLFVMAHINVQTLMSANVMILQKGIIGKHNKSENLNTC